MKRPTPALADDDSDESSVQRIIPAHTSSPPLTSAANSIFDVGRKAKVATKRQPFNWPAVVVHHGVPKPPPRAIELGGYQQLIARMGPGDSVDLPLRQARGLVSQSLKDPKHHGASQKFSIRTTSSTNASVWRDA